MNTQSQIDDLRRMMERFVECAGNSPIPHIQTNRVQLWLRKLAEVEEAADASNMQPFA